MTPSGYEHGRIVGSLTRLTATGVWREKRGAVCGAETGFLIGRDPDTVRAPDVALVRADRTSAGWAGFFPGPPDLAVEVVSPADRGRDVEDNVDAWLAAGTRLVWVVRPSAAAVSSHRPGGKVITRRAGEVLEAGDVLPDFACRIHDVFAT